LTLRVFNAEKQSWNGSLVQFTGGTMTAHFWGEDLPQLGLGQPVQIEVGGINLDLPALEGCAIERIELPGGRGYRIGYTLTDDFLDHIPKPLQALFPYRSFHRVEPTEEHPLIVRVRSSAEDEWHACSVVDVSMAGIGVDVTLDVEASLQGSSTLEVELNFPGMDESRMTLAARIQHRRMDSGQVRYGVAFAQAQAGAGTENSQLERSSLDRFVCALESADSKKPA